MSILSRDGTWLSRRGCYLLLAIAFSLASRIPYLALGELSNTIGYNASPVTATGNGRDSAPLAAVRPRLFPLDAAVSGNPTSHDLSTKTAPMRSAYMRQLKLVKCNDVRDRDPSTQCEFIKRHCGESGSALSLYLRAYYCWATNTRWGMVLGMIAWIMLLFLWVGMAGSDYLSPNLSIISQLLRLPESIAGVTLLAVGNGAPDLFTTLSAARAHSGCMAIGELIGGASCIVLGVVGLIVTMMPNIRIARLSLLRELSFFCATLCLILVAILAAQIGRVLALCLVGFYVLYVLTVTLTTFHEERVAQQTLTVREARQLFSHVGEEAEGVLTPTGLSGEDLPGAEAQDPLESEINELQYEWWRDHCRSRNRSLLLAAEFRDFLELLGDLTHRQILTPRDQSQRREAYEMSESVSSSQSMHCPRLDGESQLQGAAMRPPEIHVMPATPGLEATDLLTRYSADSIEYSRPQVRSAATSPLFLPSERYLDISTFAGNRSENGDSHLSPSQSHPSVQFSTGASSPRHSFQFLTSPFSHVRSGSSSRNGRNSFGTGAGSQWWSWAKAMLRVAVPTLRHWRSNTSRTSKCFLVFSVLPVFALTITVPVVSADVDGDNPSMRNNGHQSETCVHDALLHSTIMNTSPTNHPYTGFPSQLSPRCSVDSCPISSRLVSSPCGSLVLPSDLSIKTVESVYSQRHDPLVHGVPPEITQRARHYLALAQCVISPMFIAGGMGCHVLGMPGSTVAVAFASGVAAMVAYVAVVLRAEQRCRPVMVPYAMKLALCFVGFVAGLTWVCLIADEMVAVLKTFGVIFGLSEDILGLTVMGWGNSIGDLVANITMARIGYPRMAIAACFGGPMLNILLGVGLSANTVITKSGGQPFRITPSSPAILVSTLILLATMIWVVLTVSANGYMVTRKVGVVLLAVYTLELTVNVCLEYYAKSLAMV